MKYEVVYHQRLEINFKYRGSRPGPMQADQRHQAGWCSQFRRLKLSARSNLLTVSTSLHHLDTAIEVVSLFCGLEAMVPASG